MIMTQRCSPLHRKPTGIRAAIILAALGYFVDVYDLLLFSVVRIQSLQSLGISGDELLSSGLFLLNMQMTGMLIGGVLWGIWGDKKGRLSVLFGSIFLYSLANVLNAFVQSVQGYALLRLLAGIGLAGELGAGITLVSENMPSDKRGYGATIIATIGVMGAVLAAFVGELFPWRTAYLIGGGLGFLLLFFRVGVFESGLFQAMNQQHVRRGDLSLLLGSRKRAFRYLCCILIGLPIWFVIGIFITLSPEFGKALSMPILPVASRAVLYAYIGLAIGDMSSGLLSQFFRSRKKAITLFLAGIVLSCFLFLQARGASLFYFYSLCCCLGVCCGYWAVFITMAAEQFGTNLRATVTTTVPNFVRGAVVPITSLFGFLRGSQGTLQAAMYVGALCLVLAFLALAVSKESFAVDLDFFES